MLIFSSHIIYTWPSGRKACGDSLLGIPGVCPSFNFGTFKDISPRHEPPTDTFSVPAWGDQEKLRERSVYGLVQSIPQNILKYNLKFMENWAVLIISELAFLHPDIVSF